MVNISFNNFELFREESRDYKIGWKWVLVINTCNSGVFSSPSNLGKYSKPWATGFWTNDWLAIRARRRYGSNMFVQPAEEKQWWWCSVATSLSPRPTSPHTVTWQPECEGHPPRSLFRPLQQNDQYCVPSTNFNGRASWDVNRWIERTIQTMWSSHIH